jgi:hypothetical protein
MNSVFGRKWDQLLKYIFNPPAMAGVPHLGVTINEPGWVECLNYDLFSTNLCFVSFIGVVLKHSAVENMSRVVLSVCSLAKERLVHALEATDECDAGWHSCYLARLDLGDRRITEGGRSAKPQDRLAMGPLLP